MRVAVVLMAVAVCSAATPAQAADWRAVNDAQLAPWPNIQGRDGKFEYRTYVGTESAYGEAVMGYALIMKANRTGDRRALRSGVRAIRYAVRTVNDIGGSVFEAVAIPASYNLLRRTQPGAFASVKRELAAWIRRVRVLRIHRFGLLSNKSVAEAVAILELLATGVRSRDPKTIVGRPAKARSMAIRMLVDRVPNIRSEDTLVMSDRIDFPLAYHALSQAFYARAVQLLGDAAPPVVRQTVVRLAEASLRATAPDGEPAYNGRSQNQVWSLAGTVYGASQAARYAPEKAPAFWAVADRIMRRLNERYPVTPDGQLMIPAMTRGGLAVYRQALDKYANGVSYPGLAAMFLGWAVEEGPNPPVAPSSGIPADNPGFTAVLSQENGRVAVVRSGDLWFAVKGKRAGRRQWIADYRYDFGLIVAKRQQGGSWRDFVPSRPRTTGTQPVSAGPVVRIGGRTGYPGGRVDVLRDGTVEIVGRYEDRNGAPLRPAVFRYRPVGDCIILTTEAVPGESYYVGAFFAGTPEVNGSAIRDDRAEVRLNLPFTVRVRGPYASSDEPNLKLARATVRARAAGVLQVAYC